MGRELFRGDPHFASLLELASDLAGADLGRTCLRGPDRELLRASIVQPLMVAVCLGYLRHVRAAGVFPDRVLGHSLGEITALAASGVVDDHEAVRIAAERGRLMEERARETAGGMTAVLFVSPERVEEVLASPPHEVVVANVNSPDQVVISGSREGLDAAAESLGREPRARCRRLRVAGPWHSPLMEPARREFARWVAGRRFAPPTTPIIMNATGGAEQDPERIRELLIGQLTGPVFFDRCLRALAEAGIERIVEIGPGRVLAGLVRANGLTEGISVHNANNLRGLERLAG